MAQRPGFIVTGIVGLLMVVGGIALLLFVGRQRFNRTNQYGVQTYGSYSEAVGSGCGDGCLKVTGVLLVLGGILAGLGATVGLVLYLASTSAPSSSGAPSQMVIERGPRG